jgi:uncharacterized protein
MMSSPAAQYSVVDAPERERFEVRVGEETAGFTAYRRQGGTIAFMHTEVAHAFEGKGVGSRLMARALEAAREEDRLVLPYCPFVRGYIARHPDQYLDLVPRDQRQFFGLPSDG